MISGDRPTVVGSSAGSPSGSVPSGSRRAARWPWVRWALSSEVAACTACSICSSTTAPVDGAAGAASRAAAAAAAGRRRRGRGPELGAERGEDAVVEAVIALQVGLDDLQEAPRLRALDDAVVVGRGHGHDLLGADHVADVLQAHRVGDRAGGDDRALADHQARDRGDGADPARVGERDVGAGEVVGGQRVGARLLDELVEGGLEVGEVLAARVADDGDHERARAVLLLHVDGDAEVDLTVVDAMGLAVAVVEVVGHDRHVVLRGLGDGVGDEVGEGDLLAAVLELLAAGVHRGDGDGPERGRRRDRAALVHVAGEHRRAALQERRAAVGAGRRGRGAGASPSAGAAAVLPFPTAEDVGLGDAPAGPAARDRAEVDALGGGHARGHGGDLGVVGDGGRGRSGRLGGARRCPTARASAWRRPAPTCMRAMTWPTVTVSPSSARISVIVPAVGAGSSMSTLSVEISTTAWPSSTASPTLTDHSRMVPSVTDSPPAGVTMSTISPPVAAGASVSVGASASAALAPAPAPPARRRWRPARPRARRRARRLRVPRRSRSRSRPARPRRSRCRPRRRGS